MTTFYGIALVWALIILIIGEIKALDEAFWATGWESMVWWMAATTLGALASLCIYGLAALK